ncbi:hypothetical protein [Cupriavidus sp. TMH.W2]|uniref:hypothetical protein n=1 Tax=Cupriavidus sp. TMH.W2 TaxID=3434465 RepID=UPI003D789B3C
MANKEGLWCPDQCPISGLPFFMWLNHPELGYVPTYGGPFDSYTLAMVTDDGDIRSERYDPDAGEWVEGGEPMSACDDLIDAIDGRTPNASPPVAPKDEREAFEHRCYYSEGAIPGCVALERDRVDDYRDLDTNSAWEVWQLACEWQRSTALAKQLHEPAAPVTQELIDAYLKALPWLDSSTVDPIEKARRVLRHLIQSNEVYFFDDGYPRRDVISRNAECVLKVIDHLAILAQSAPRADHSCDSAEMVAAPVAELIVGPDAKVRDIELRAGISTPLAEGVYPLVIYAPSASTPQAGPELEPVYGDVLPPLRADVLIHLASLDKWVPHKVIGYYVWPSLKGDPSGQRVFVRVRDSAGTPNARMLCDVRRPDGTSYLPAATTQGVSPDVQAEVVQIAMEGDAAASSGGNDHVAVGLADR